jgi:hypothetical protein
MSWLRKLTVFIRRAFRSPVNTIVSVAVIFALLGMIAMEIAVFR